MIPGSGRSSREGNGNPLQYPCLRNPMDRVAWWAIIHEVANSQTQQRINNNNKHSPIKKKKKFLKKDLNPGFSAKLELLTKILLHCYSLVVYLSVNYWPNGIALISCYHKNVLVLYAFLYIFPFLHDQGQGPFL